MRRWIAYVLLALALGAPGAHAQAQTSQPARPEVAPPRAAVAWARAVLGLADALVRPDAGDAPLAAAMPAGTVIRRFDNDLPQDRLSLRAATSGAVVVSALSYAAAPDTLAGDLARDVRQAEFLPEDLRGAFALEGEAAIKHANDTAAQWLTGALQPGVQQPVGLIALWQEPAAEASTAPPTSSRGTMIFILLKGRQLASGDYAVSCVIYGDVGHLVR